MEELIIIKNKYYYLKNKNLIKSLVISKNEIKSLNLNNYILLLNSKNYYKYKNNNNVLEIIEDINLKKLNEIDNFENYDALELCNIISSKLSKNDNKLNYIIKTESYDKYCEIIKPYIESIYEENTLWIHEIIKGNREKENVIFKDSKIIILKELSMINNKKFYLLGFPLKKITCLREITKTDIPLLDSIVEKMKKLALQISNIKSENLYFFFHYHPSFYHLHIHCTFIENQLISNKFLRYHFYTEVKNNILKDKNFYKKNNLYFEIPINHIICKLLN
tara:strand:- start:350 stop:1183 length:834 start_codon:yes stop_codon:yes gene_type:complete